MKQYKAKWMKDCLRMHIGLKKGFLKFPLFWFLKIQNNTDFLDFHAMCSAKFSGLPDKSMSSLPYIHYTLAKKNWNWNISPFLELWE